MAVAKVEDVYEVAKRVVLALSNEEASTLRAVLRCVAGDPNSSRRGIADRILEALEQAEVPRDESDIAGEVRFLKIVKPGYK